jgi:hypothetical protein
MKTIEQLMDEYECTPTSELIFLIHDYMQALEAADALAHDAETVLVRGEGPTADGEPTYLQSLSHTITAYRTARQRLTNR